MFWVYIIYSASRDKYYIGHTKNLKDRIKRHNQGRSKATKTGNPWILVYVEEHSTKSEAYKREIKIKSWKSRDMIKRLIAKV